jgi:5-methylcytosine-specific restriction endonuclease McrA
MARSGKAHYNSRTYKTNRRIVLAGYPSCAICGLPGADSVDHIIPVSRGGHDGLDNLRPAHSKCNGQRGNRMRTRYGAKW